MRFLISCFVLMLCMIACSGHSIGDQAKLLGTREFTVDGWAAGTQEQRGEMLASFLAKHKPTMLTAKEVVGLLGSPTGYYEYDEYPAYFIGPASVDSEYGKGYLLAFVTDKSSGKVLKVVLVPEVGK